MRSFFNITRSLIEDEAGAISAVEALIFLCLAAAVLLAVNYAVVSQTPQPSAGAKASSSSPSPVSVQAPWPQLGPRKPLNWEQTEALKK